MVDSPVPASLCSYSSESSVPELDTRVAGHVTGSSGVELGRLGSTGMGCWSALLRQVTGLIAASPGQFILCSNCRSWVLVSSPPYSILKQPWAVRRSGRSQLDAWKPTKPRQSRARVPQLNVSQRPIRTRPGVLRSRSDGLLQPYNCVAEDAITWNDSP